MAKEEIITYVYGQALEVDPAVKKGFTGTATSQESGQKKRENREAKEEENDVYYLPRNKMEELRLAMQHEMSKLVMGGKLGLAPVKSPKHVLDVASGTGIWAREFAELNPTSSVVGMDLVKMQSQETVANCHFVKRDVEKDEWGFDHQFDYIHLGYVISCFDDTKTVMRKAYAQLEEGGYIEFLDTSVRLIDFDGSLQGTALNRWADLINQGGRRVGRDLQKSERYAEWCSQVGFVDVIKTAFQVPQKPRRKGEAMGQVESYFRKDFMMLVDSLTKFVRLAGLTSDETAKLERQTKRDLTNPEIHFGAYILVIVGRKLESGGQ